MVEQFPEEYIMALDAILKTVDDNPTALIEAMVQCNNDKRMYEYYTIESALAYLTYKEMLNNPDMEQPKKKLIMKMKDNLQFFYSEKKESTS